LHYHTAQAWGTGIHNMLFTCFPPAHSISVIYELINAIHMWHFHNPKNDISISRITHSIFILLHLTYSVLHCFVHFLTVLQFYNYNPRANGAKRRSGRKPGARVTNSALAFTCIRIMRCYIAQWHSGIKSRPIRHFLCHGRWYVI
jgi:hypothetical protein